MIQQVLLKEYKSLQPDLQKIFVIPLIGKVNKQTNYLYQLYRPLIEKENPGNPEIESLSVFAHPKIFFSRLKGEKIILHYHWFEVKDVKSLSGIFWKLLWLILYKFSGGKMIWTVHNKYPHEGYRTFNKFNRIIMARLADRLHVHCSSAIEITAPVLKAKKEKYFVVPHPGFEVKVISKEESGNILNKKYPSIGLRKDDTLFLMFGAIARYKGIKEVIEIFNELPPGKKLIVAGFIKKGNEEYFGELNKLIEDKGKIILISKLIPDEDVPVFFNSTDYAIFNYDDVLTSGGVHLALNYKKPVIIPSIGCLKELKGEGIFHFEIKGSRKENLLKVIKELK
jgi:beta-1,4-mannosyltransferase